MKRILFYLIVFLIVFLIYYFNCDKKIYYLSIGDYLSYGINNFKNQNNGYSEAIKEKYKSNLKNYVNYSTLDDYRVMDLMNDINYNKTIIYKGREYKIQNLLVKSNLITISIGMNDLIYKSNLSYDYVDELLNDMNNLLELIRKYNKDKIYFLSFYNVINNENLIEYSNERLKKICEKNNIIYVDISDLDNYIIKGTYPTNDGYLYIKNKIINFTKN